MANRMQGRAERLRPANQMKIGRRAGETVQITRPAGQPGRPRNGGASFEAREAALKSRMARREKAVDQFRRLKRQDDIVRAAMGGRTPVSPRGIPRATTPILPPRSLGAAGAS